MRANRIGFPSLALAGEAAALRGLDFRIGLGKRLAAVAPEPERSAPVEVCAVCGDTRDPAIGFCTGCGSRERIRLVEEQPHDQLVRLVGRVDDTLAAEAMLHPPAGAAQADMAAVRQARVIYTRLGSQRRLLRDRLLRARSADDRELYQQLLQRVERALGQGAAR